MHSHELQSVPSDGQETPETNQHL